MPLMQESAACFSICMAIICEIRNAVLFFVPVMPA